MLEKSSFNLKSPQIQLKFYDIFIFDINHKDGKRQFAYRH